MKARQNNNALLSKKIDEKHIFFYLKWQELLDQKTIDIYQYNILNTCSACVEFNDVISKTLSGLFTSRQNIDDVKNEVLSLISEDEILKSHNKALFITLMRIISPKLGTKSEDLHDNSFIINLNRLKSHLQRPTKELDSYYFSYILLALKQDIENQDLSLINKHTSVLVSQCIYMGWSARGLIQLLDILEYNEEINADDKWNLFVEKLSVLHLKSYSVFFNIQLKAYSDLSINEVIQLIKDLGINLLSSEDICSEYRANTNLIDAIEHNKYYSVTDIQSTDAYSAALKAINNLNNLLSIASFYNVISPDYANTPRMVVLNNDTLKVQPMNINDLFKTYDYLDSSNYVYLDTRNIYSDHLKRDVANKIKPAFIYTNLSRSSLFQETKYITLWIALESVMRTGQYHDIISHIKQVLPSTLCTKYIYRIVRNFAEDCKRCGINTLVAPLFVDLNTENKKELVFQLIRIFRTAELQNQVLDLCSVNKLLYFRCQEINILLNNSTLILDKLDAHKKRVEWHIQRLYRLRNEITHSAFQGDKSLIIYIEHIYTYLAQLISEVVNYIEHKGAISIEEVYAAICDTYQTYIELLKRESLTIDEIIPDGIISIPNTNT